MPMRHKDAPPEDALYAPIEWESAHDGYEDVIYEKADGIARITINRPERRNAFRPPTLAELRDAFTRARDDLDVGSIILTGAGDEAFCSGGDQKIRGDDGYIGSDEVAQKGVGRLDVGDLHVQIRRTPKPVVAAVAGLGGRRRPHPPPRLRSDDRGRERPIRADRPACGQLRRRLRGGPARSPGRRQAGEGDLVPVRGSTTPTRRSRWGSSTRSSRPPELQAEAVAWCREMSYLSPLSLRLLKSSFNAAEDGITGIQQLSHDATLLFYMTEEGQEGRNAYQEGRAPEFSDFEKFPRRP